ncbi:biotin--[acetyl-CoA-carboxylase] ligase [Cyclobacteriaceae bacterium]|nr:biotin--[acetyl-CoA-carboxylase] ligase [Cyclobacteriaceae bacterium]
MYKKTLNTHFVGQTRLDLPTCRSTNDFLKEMLEQGLVQNGQLVITTHQTDGRGQRASTWQSEPNKNLTFSIGLFDIELPSEQQFQLNIITSLAVIKTINENTKANAQIKWPNDIYIDNKKVAGILIEQKIKKETIDQAVIGLGLNINQQQFDLPHASSLANAIGGELDLEDFLTQFLQNFEHFLFRKEDFDGLKELYYQNLMRYQVPALYRKDDVLFAAIILGINQNGQLILQEETQTSCYNIKEISFEL